MILRYPYHSGPALHRRVPFWRCEHSISVSARHFLVVLHIETRVTCFRWRSVCLSVKSCALIGLQMMAEENALRSDRDSSLDLGEMWNYGCPKSLVWSDDGLEEERGEDTSPAEYYELDVDDLAIEVVGQNRTSEVISPFLEDWEVRRVASSCHLSMDLLCQEMRDVQGELRASGFSSLLLFGVPKKLSGGIVTAAKLFSHRGRAVTSRRTNLVRDIKEKERVRRAFLRCAG